MPNFRLVINTLGLQGLKPVVYRLQTGQQSPAGVGTDYPDHDQLDSSGTIIGQSSAEAPKSWLGTPVFCDILFLREDEDPIKLETVLVDVSQRKNIVTTAVQGRNGTVKEYISDGDYEVRIRGLVVSNGTNAYPYNQVRDLHDLLAQSEAINIVADYLRLFNIYKVVVTGYNFPQQEGFQNVQAFEINCISDTPEELIEEDVTS